jgi:hypothetical protein
LEVIRGVLASMTSPMQVLKKILHMEESSKIHTIVLLWTWWSERNKIREGKGRISPEFLDHETQVYVAEIL